MLRVDASAIEVARYYGLATDYRATNPLEDFGPPDGFQAQLEDPSDVFSINDSIRPPEERLHIGPEAVAFLSSVTKPPPRAKAQFEKCPRVPQVRDLKQELPILSSDPELDLLDFRRPVAPDLKNEFLPFESVDEENDEGFTWPSKYLGLVDQIWKSIESEKLDIGVNALACLQNAVKSPTIGDDINFEGVPLAHKRNTLPLRIDSPLLPMPPRITPFEPSSETGYLELLSNRTSPTREELLKLEQLISQKDAISLAKNGRKASTSPLSDSLSSDIKSLGQIYSPLKGIEKRPLSPEVSRRSLRDRKVESPLTPPMSDQIPPWKRKNSIEETLLDIIPELQTPLPRPENVSSDDIDRFFAETIVPVATQATRAIEQEQLQEADTTSRVRVPNMDFSLPKAPWDLSNMGTEESKREYRRAKLSDMKSQFFHNHVWPLNAKKELALSWVPFPAALAKVDTDEAICDDESTVPFLTQPQCDNRSTLTKQSDTLLFLRGLQDVDEEIEEGTFTEEKDFGSLLRKRKFEMLAKDENKDSDAIDLVRKGRIEDLSHPSTNPHNQARNNDVASRGDLRADQNFSAPDHLQSFIALRKGNRERLIAKADRYFGKESLHSRMAKEPVPCADPMGSKLKELPAPRLPNVSQPLQCFVSHTFLHDRRLARRIQKLLPSAEFFERDFDAHEHTLDSPYPDHSPARMKSSGTYEADIIISPGIGLMWTTLTKIKQRSLPGQVTQSSVREHVLQAAPKFERLIVLISENRSEAADHIKLSEGDCKAYIDFATFCSGLEAEIQVNFIAGGEDHLADWIATMMSKHAFTDPDFELTQDEGPHEHFLRKAGFNTFAAQAVMWRIRSRYHPGDRATHKGVGSGLYIFLRMSLHERWIDFEDFFYGRSLLTRVSTRLESRW